MLSLEACVLANRLRRRCDRCNHHIALNREVKENQRSLEDLVRVIDIDAQLLESNHMETYALNYVVQYGREEHIQLLLKNARIDLNKKFYCKTALVGTILSTHTPGVRCLLADDRLIMDDMSVEYILQLGRRDYLELAVSYGKINPDTWRSQEKRKTLLHLAMYARPRVRYLRNQPVWDDCLDMLDLAISYVKSHGLDPNARDHKGLTALHCSVVHFDDPGLPLIKKLAHDLRDALDIEAKSEEIFGETALEIARRFKGRCAASSFDIVQREQHKYWPVVKFLEAKLEESRNRKALESSFWRRLFNCIMRPFL